MSAKTMVLLCAQLLLVKSIVGISVGAGGCGCGCGCETGIPSSGNRAFVVQSVSPVTPSGLYVVSDNQIAGQLAVAGQLPFLGAVAVEGCVPDEGCSAVAYSCGGCNIGITAENNNAGAAGLRGCCCGY